MGERHSWTQINVVDIQHPDVDRLLSELRSYNAVAAGGYDRQQLILLAQGPCSRTTGIAKAYTQWGWCHLERLFVDVKMRGCGVGTQLLETVERHAAMRGCHSIHLESFTFQAPEFYLKNGYEVFGQLQSYPAGHAQLSLRKLLSLDDIDAKGGADAH
jgi:GNAT superfamily N-acetyltransferase